MKNYCKLLEQVKVFNQMPTGWKETKYAMTAPNGYIWIYNGKSIFSSENQHALLKVTN